MSYIELKYFKFTCDTIDEVCMKSREQFAIDVTTAYGYLDGWGWQVGKVGKTFCQKHRLDLTEEPDPFRMVFLP